MGHKVSSGGIFLSYLLLAMVLGVGLVACGSNPGGGTTTGTAPTATATISSSATSTSTNTSDGQKCGTISVSARGALEDAGLSTKAATCFWQAYQQCHAASLVYRVNGLDTSTVRTFTLEKKNGSCAIHDAVQHFVVPHQIGATKNYTCSAIVNSNNQLHISGCGEDGTVVIPIASV